MPRATRIRWLRRARVDTLLGRARRGEDCRGDNDLSADHGEIAMPDANRPPKPAAKSSAGAATSRTPQLPPRVVRKTKQKNVRREPDGVEREKGPAAPHSELL